MNERIKQLAEQAGYKKDMFGIGHWDMPECIRFAELVRQDERQAIKQAEKESTLQEMSDIGQDIEWDTSDMAHRSGGLSVEQEKLCKYCGGIGRVVCGGKCMPEQEPVAWMGDSIEFYAKDHPTNSCTIPLYTAPVKRKWVGLTDKEIAEYSDMFNGIRLIKAIEALLRERNT